ncbi:MAG TPA: MOSC domain-containing protein [Actinotalea caeni]|uniref:MOSC domain-containing protein n=1 Tax=Actinotalea caeni TaxID=1348467 RepID=UPI002B4B1DEF|nr:MOSC domain-containing protein [Actinotalea caeni]HLV54874.1 MOSC domain-containing protein [Actinotalea caeni]
MSVVVSVSADATHRFSKEPQARITLVEGLGVAGDAHAGATVQHRSRVRRDPTQPNLRQVHLIHAELLEEVNAHGHEVGPGTLGENVLTRGVDLLALPRDTRLRIGQAVLRVTGLRNPCRQIDDARPGLLARVVGRAPDGSVVRRCGVMAVVERGGDIAPGDAIVVEIPQGAQEPLQPV